MQFWPDGDRHRSDLVKRPQPVSASSNVFTVVV